MTPPLQRPTLVCGGLSFENAPVEIREKVAFPEHRIPDALQCIRTALGLEEAVILSTCNRVEYFGSTTDATALREAWPRFLREFHGVSDDITPFIFQHEERECVEHLYQVAAGLKSMVIGETEILGQVKTAYDIARQEGATSRWLNRLFQSSFAAAKTVRSSTAITRGSVSVGSVAVELSEKIFGDLHNCKVMVIGAGETGERTARSLQSRGVTCLLVANRTYEHARELAEQLKGRAVQWDQWEEEAAGVDIMISSTSAPHYVLTREKLIPVLRRRNGRPLFLIDLAVPRDFEPAINLLDDVFLYDIDDLQSIATRNLIGRAAEVDHGIQILRPHVDKFFEWAAATPTTSGAGWVPGHHPTIA